MNRAISRMFKISLLIFLVTTLIGVGVSMPINAELMSDSAINASAPITNTTYNDQEALQLLEKVLQKTETDKEVEIVTTAFLIMKPNLKNPILSSSSTTLKSTSVQDAVKSTEMRQIRCGTPYIIQLLQVVEKDPDLKEEIQMFLTASLDRTYETDHFYIHYTTTSDDAVPTDDNNSVDDWSNFTDSNGNGTWDPGEHLNDDVGKDGMPNTGDEGEGNGVPDEGEPRTEPDYVERAGEYFEKSWQTEINDWGYREPSSLLSSKYEVYIKNITVYGSTYPLLTGDSTIDIANWMTYDTVDDSDFLTTCAHEYHHASQNKYIFLNALLREIWVIEGSAAWIEHEIGRLYYPTGPISELGWWTGEMSYYLLHPHKDLTSGFDQYSDGGPRGYPTGMYFWFLANNTQIDFTGTGTKIAINKKIWEELSTHSWVDVTGAFDDAISHAPSEYNSFDESFIVFPKANYFKSSWYPSDWVYTAMVTRVPVNLVGTTETKTYSGDATVDGISIHTINQYAAEYFVISAPKQSEIFVTFDGQGNEFFMNHFLNGVENNELGPFKSVLSASWVYHDNTASDTVLIIGRLGDSGDGNFTLKFAPIVPNIIKPTQTGPGNVGPHNNPSKTFVEVDTKTSEGMFVPGLDKKEYYIVEIGDKAATILNVVEKPDRYVLEVMPPEQDSDGLYNLNVTLGSLSDVETNAINYGAKGVDMALIIDSSGSMETNDPGDFRKTAAKQFVALANIGDQICVADFGHSGCNSRLLLQLLGIIDESSRNTMDAAIDQVVSYGSTPIGYGLQRGYNELSSSRAVASHNKAGVLLTDGMDTCDTEGTARTYASSFKSNGWSLYTIALTGDADEAFLNELASLGNGEYAGKAPTNEELHEIYRIISGRVLGEQTTTTVEGTAQQSQTSIETALIDSSVTSAKFAISWPGSDLDLTLERPDGGIIDPYVAAADPGIDYTSAASYEFYAVDSPMAGEWKLRIFGVDVPAEGEDYTGSVMAVTDVTMNMYLDRDEYATGEPIKASVSISDETQPITNATVIADVELPMATTSSSTKALAGKDYITEEEKSELASLRASLQTTSPSLHDQITLFDDGMHGDGIADDGVYANFYTNTSVEGTYKFTVKASGTTNTGEEFTRVAEQSTYVTGASTPEISVTPTTWSFEFERDISVEKNFTVVSSVDTIASMTATDLTDESGNVITSTNVSFYPSVQSLSANEPQNFTANLTIPQNSHAGNYKGSIIITAPECTLNVEVTITYDLIRVPEDYPTIQDAVNAASAGATIQISSGIYTENVEITKDRITLQGENRNITIIDGGGSAKCINITADNVEVTGFMIQNGTDGVYVHSSNGCSIAENRILDNYDGIHLINSDGNTIVCNILSNNIFYFTGIHLSSSNDNTIYNNDLSKNGGGISIYNSNNNQIYHNNLINNGNQARDNTGTNRWDNGYPSGGNYWDDYRGSDAYKGPNQTMPGSDGIGDTPYGIIGGVSAHDRYPFMNADGWSTKDLTVTILYPNGGESLPIGTQVQVSARATDDAAVTSVTFSYSSNSGSNWNSIGVGTRVSGTANDGIWNQTWNTNWLDAGSSYRIRAVAGDGASTREDQSDNTFSLTPSTTNTTVSIESTTSSTCDTVSITIDTNEAAGIGGAHVALTYDASKVSLNSVSNGALGAVTWNDVSGTVAMVADALSCPTGSNIKFADLEFCPVAALGCSALDMEVIELYDCDLQSITPAVNDGEFCISGETPPSAPALNDPGTTDTDGSYTVSWSSVSGATSYTLEGDTSSSFSSPAVVYSGSGTSTQITDMANGTYYYRVNACNACGCGGWSNVVDIVVSIPQGAGWNRTFGGADNDVAYSVQQTSDGGFILAGYTNSYGAGSSDFWLVKTDSSGTKQWDKTFGATESDIARSVHETSDGGYILAGCTNSYGAGSYDAWLVRINSNGDIMWHAALGGTGWDMAESVQQTSDGGFIFAGYTGSYGAGFDDAWLVKVGSDGCIQWNKTFGGSGRDVATSVQETSDGGYIIAGSTQPQWSYLFSTGFVNPLGVDFADAWLVKIDSNGNMQWDMTFGGADWDTAESVQQTSDGGYVLAGYTKSYGAGDFDFWLIKTYSNGNKQWDKTFGETNDDYAYSVQQTSDGGYILAGVTEPHSDPPAPISESLSPFGAGGSDFWLVKTDSEGGKEWDKTFGGTDDDYASSVQETSDDGYVLAGYTKSYGAGGSDFWLVKVGGAGVPVPSTPTLNDPGTTDTDGSYTVAWSNVSGATSYTLEEGTSSSFGSHAVVYSGSGTSTQITDMADGTYYYRVNACNACGCGGWSNVGDIEILTGVNEVCRNLPLESQIAGDIITVSLDVTVGSATYYAVDEVVPTGWTVVSASDGGSTVVAGHVKWFVMSGVTDTTLTYNVQIPHGASGTYTFGPGEWRMKGMSNSKPIHCDTVVVVCAPPSTPPRLTPS